MWSTFDVSEALFCYKVKKKKNQHPKQNKKGKKKKKELIMCSLLS